MGVNKLTSWQSDLAAAPVWLSEQCQTESPGRRRDVPISDEVIDDDRLDRCREAVERIRVKDGKDGSRRLYTVACRCVEHDLTDDQAVALVREHERKQPFPRDWSDDEIVARLRDAEKECQRGSALEDQTPPPEKKANQSQANQVAQMILNDPNIELFHSPEGDAYATGPSKSDGPSRRDTMKIDSKAFRRYVARLAYERLRLTVKSLAVKDALVVISGHALYDGPEYEVAVRVAHHDGRTYLDLADEEGRVVEVTPDGWRVIYSTDLPPAVRFLRPSGMLSLPVPQRGGRVDELRPLLNIQSDADWYLLVAFLVVCWIVGGAYPVLIFVGEQGSGKSTRARIIIWLIDPRKPALRRPPRNEQDLMIAAKNGLLIGYDNLSGLPHDLSDAICSLATGGGFGARRLYTDEDENLIDAKRPVMLNGIDDLANRSDLMDRAIIITLKPIPSSQRRAESELNAAFERVRPRVLGALLDAGVAVLANRDTATLPELPRMADFARNIVAAERALGWPEGAFLAAYRANQNAAHVQAVETSPIGNALLQLMEDRDTWSGTPSELLRELVIAAVSVGHYEARSWPRVAGLGKQLRRLAPNLRALGVEVETGRRSGDDRQRFITLRRTPTPAPGSTTS